LKTSPLQAVPKPVAAVATTDKSILTFIKGQLVDFLGQQWTCKSKGISYDV
jgi:hypothetical protein